MLVFCIVPIVSLIAGIILLKTASVKINSFYGFRTKTSTRNKQTWEYCNRLCAAILIAIGAISTILVIAFHKVTTLFLGIFEFGELVNIIVIAIILLSIPVINFLCKRKYPDTIS